MSAPPTLRRYISRRAIRLGMAVAAGGALGAAARQWTEERWPPAPGTFPVTTLMVNASGCLAMGILMVLAEETLRGRVYAWPFAGVGLLGGFTTFSLVAGETRTLLVDHPALAAEYLIGTPIVAVAATAAGFALASSTLTLRARLADTRRQS